MNDYNMQWTAQEESNIAAIMSAGMIERLPAIRLYARCSRDMQTALRVAAKEAPTEAELHRREVAKSRMAKARLGKLALVSAATAADQSKVAL